VSPGHGGGMDAGSNPTLRRRELGSRLRELRTQAGLTVEQVAAELECTASKISRIETARRAVSLRDVRDLCRIYGVSDQDHVNRLVRMAREAKERGWWQQFGDLGEGIAPLIGLQSAAAFITDYESSFVPALLQTEPYARAVIRGALPQIRPEVLEQRVEARMLRQKLLYQDDAPRFWGLLDEAVLHRRVGGNAVMKEQLARIVEIGEELSNVTIQTIPFDVGAHPGMDSTFVFIEFDEVSPVIFVESLAGSIYLERESDITRYRETIAHLRAMALNPTDSLLYIAQVAREL
jgi:transcriptional regulator with XRE-family HTH domain